MSIRSFLKKACILGVSAVMSFGGWCNIAGAIPPDNNVTGIRYDSLFIKAAEGSALSAVVILNKSLRYNYGNNLFLIDTNSSENGAANGVTVKLTEGETTTNLNDSTAINNGSANGVALYLRVVGPNSGANIGWTKVWENGYTLTSNDPGIYAIVGAQKGEYQIYYYIDGGNLYSDVGANS